MSICIFRATYESELGNFKPPQTKLVYSLFASQHKYYVHSDSIRGIKVNTPAVYPCALTLGVNIWSAPYFLFAGLGSLHTINATSKWAVGISAPPHRSSKCKRN